MSDLFESNDLVDNVPEFSVSDISRAIKKMIEGEFSYVKIRGELGRVSKPASGHIYLDIKDEKSVLSGIVWKPNFQIICSSRRRYGGCSNRKNDGVWWTIKI